MSKMSDLSIAIQEALMDGSKTFEEIAAELEVPLDWVLEADRELAEYESDGQPDELTEWMDFDPDC